MNGGRSAPAISRWKPPGRDAPVITDADLDHMIAHATPIRRDAAGKVIWPWPYARPVKPARVIRPEPAEPARPAFPDWREDFV